MKHTFLLLALVMVGCVHAETLPPPPASVAEVAAGTSKTKFVSPYTLASVGGGGVGFYVNKTNGLAYNLSAYGSHVFLVGDPGADPVSFDVYNTDTNNLVMMRLSGGIASSSQLFFGQYGDDFGTICIYRPTGTRGLAFNSVGTALGDVLSIDPDTGIVSFPLGISHEGAVYQSVRSDGNHPYTVGDFDSTIVFTGNGGGDGDGIILPDTAPTGRILTLKFDSAYGSLTRHVSVNGGDGVIEGMPSYEMTGIGISITIQKLDSVRWGIISKYAP